MKHIKYLLLAILLLACVAPAHALLKTDLVSYYTFDGDDQDTTTLFDVHGTQNGTNTGNAAQLGVNSSGILGEAYHYDNANAYTTLAGDSWLNVSNTWSTSFWTNLDTSSNDNVLVSHSNGGVYWYLVERTDKNGVVMQYDPGPGGAVYSVPTIDIGTGTWNHIVMVQDGTNLTIYQNGTVVSTQNNFSDVNWLEANIELASGAAGANLLDGYMDEVAFWNRSITGAEVQEIYNSGTGIIFANWDTIIPFDITAKQFWDNSSITTFNATVNGTMYGTTNGTIVTNLNQSQAALVDITVIKPNYFNRTYLNYNISSTLASSIWQVIVMPNATDILNASVTADYYKAGTQTHTTTLYLGAGANNLTFNKSGWYEKTQEFTYSALDNTTSTIENVFSTQLNITAINYTGGDITAFNITVEGISDSYATELTTTGTEIIFNSTNATFNFSIDAGSNWNTDEQQVIIENYTQALQFMLYTHNSINITFFDEVGSHIINDATITLEFISDLYSDNATTATGLMYLDLLYPTSYTLRYSGNPDYPERFYTFTMTNRTHNTLDLFLLNSSDSQTSNLTISLIDQYSDAISEGEIKVLKYNQSSNSYNTVEIVTTNDDGEAVSQVQLNIEFYKFIVYVDGVLEKTTAPTYLYSDILTIQVTLGDLAGQVYDNMLGVDYTLTFNPATNNFDFTYSDSSNLVSKGCLRITRLRAGQTSSYNNSCVSSAATTILVGVANTTGSTYIAEAYIDFGEGIEYLLDSLIQEFRDTTLSNDIMLLIVVMLTIALAGTAFYSPVVAVILTPIPLILAGTLGIVNISSTLGIPIMIAAIIVVFAIGRRS